MYAIEKMAVAGMGNKKIATTLGLPQSTTKRWLQRPPSEGEMVSHNVGRPRGAEAGLCLIFLALAHVTLVAHPNQEKGPISGAPCFEIGPRNLPKGPLRLKNWAKKEPIQSFGGAQSLKATEPPCIPSFPRAPALTVSHWINWQMGHHLQLFIVGENGLSQQRRRGRKGRSGRTSYSLS